MKIVIRPFLHFLALGAALAALPTATRLTASPLPQAASTDPSGNYGGFVQTPDNNPLTSGIISVQLLITGAFSGNVSFEGQRIPLMGKFDANTLQFDRSFPVPANFGFDSITVHASLDPSNRIITGTFTEIQESSPVLDATFTLTGELPDPTVGPQLAGSRRTAFIDPPSVSSGQQEIPGDGFAVITVGHSKKTRAARFAGRLNDYTGAFSSGSPLHGLDYTVFGNLYKVRRFSHGRTFGNAGVTFNGPEIAPGLTSTLSWGKEPTLATVRRDGPLVNTAPSGYYSGGIDATISLNSQVYPHTAAHRIVPISTAVTNRVHATLHFKRGNLLAAFDVPILMTPTHVKVTDGNPYQVTLNISAQAGLFRGSFVNPYTGVVTRFQGAFHAATGLGTPGAVLGEGRGSFAGTIAADNASTAPAESGSVRMTVTL